MRRGVTLVEMALVMLLASLVIGVVWNVLGGGMRQSSLNLGRTEALMSALLFLDTLDEDLRNLALREKGDLSLFGTEGPGARSLAFRTAKASGDAVETEEVEYRMQPAEPEHNLIVRNGRTIAGGIVSSLRFVPKVIERRNGGQLHFVQTFVSMVDSSGRYKLPLMGLAHVGVVSQNQRHPYWNANPDQSYRGAGTP